MFRECSRNIQSTLLSEGYEVSSLLANHLAMMGEDKMYAYEYEYHDPF